MIHYQSTSLDYDEWQRMGATGWSYADVLPYFQTLETFNQNGNCDLSPARRGTDGPIGVETNSDFPDLYDAFIQASEQMGITDHDLNKRIPQKEGVIQHAMRNGVRSSTWRAYLLPAMDRPNLDIVLNSSKKGLV
jgi:choline dehydrogenase